MKFLAVLPPLLPLIAAAVLVATGWNPVSAWLGVMTTMGVAGTGIVVAVDVLDHAPIVVLDGLVRVDALSAFMVIMIAFVGLIATTYGVAYVRAELEQGHVTSSGARTYGFLVQIFIAAMLVAVLTDNLGVVWVAVEATTVATTFLVGHRRTKGSLEASWKYVVIGSVGVALAFLGTVLVYFASRHIGGDADAALNWTTLVGNAHRLDPGVMRLAVGLLVLGYGTKVGLAPMHTWLPDAHSQAPAPVSGLMSGVLLSVAFYALLRYKVISDAVVGTGYMRGLLIVAALGSLAIAALLLIAQRDYKRMLAYSSIEHMGLAALGAAIGSPLAIAATLLHILGHGLSKAVVFCCSGEILLSDGTTEISGVRGLLSRRPLVGTTFGLGLLALLGLPPFSLFISELSIARAGIDQGLGVVVGVALVLLLVVFAAVVGHAQRMLLGQGVVEEGRHRTSVAAAVPMVSGLILVAGLGVSIWPIERLLRAAASVLSG